MARISDIMPNVFNDELSDLSKTGRSPNKELSPGLSRVPLITTANIAPRAVAEAQNANSIEAVDDLAASISSASEPAHADESSWVCAAWETAR